jgi:hypothetical protein
VIGRPTANELGEIAAYRRTRSGVLGDVQGCEIGAGGVGQEVELVQSEMVAQGLDVGDLADAVVRRGISRYAGVAGAAQVEHDQLPR